MSFFKDRKMFEEMIRKTYDAHFTPADNAEEEKREWHHREEERVLAQGTASRPVQVKMDSQNFLAWTHAPGVIIFQRVRE